VRAVAAPDQRSTVATRRYAIQSADRRACPPVAAHRTTAPAAAFTGTPSMKRPDTDPIAAHLTIAAHRCEALVHRLISPHRRALRAKILERWRTRAVHPSPPESRPRAGPEPSARVAGRYDPEASAIRRRHRGTLAKNTGSPH